ncbi:hypothetical protein ACIQCR_34695 [Streptomyces sp. NPDC093249]|uniref:hypothetical protein n=1 Tax=unclassified Streptomyces TaxID=2593676 RepID=UPI0037FAA656
MRSIRTSLPIIAVAAALTAAGVAPATSATVSPPTRAAAQAGGKIEYEEGLPGGKPFYFGNGNSNSPWRDTWQYKKVRYPASGGYAAPIDYLKIINNMDGADSTFSESSGGVGDDYVEFVFFAEAFSGYDYTVEIRGSIHAEASHPR